MNILILSWRGPGHPNAGGAEISTHEHAKGWVKAGHKVTLFTSSYKDCKEREFIDEIEVIRRGKQIFGVQIEAFFWYLRSGRKFNLVVDQFHGIPFFTPIYVRSLKLGFIHEVTKEVWGLNPWPWPFNLIPAVLGNFFEEWIFKLIYKNISFMTVSQSTKRDLISWGIKKSNIAVIHNGVSIVKLRPLPEKEKTKTIMFLGALSKDKGIEDAIKIFGLVDEIDPDWQFWIVGNGEENYLRFLKTKTEELGLVNKVKFWGFVSEKKKFGLLVKAHLMINTSIREGWGLVNIEANVVGTPVVGYDVPGIRDSVINGKTGFLSKFGDRDSLAKNAIWLLSDLHFYDAICSQATSWGEKFTWERSVKESTKLIENL